MIIVERMDQARLIKERWEFRPMLTPSEDGTVLLRLESYKRYERASRRHRFYIKEKFHVIFSEGRTISAKDIRMPEDVTREAEAQIKVILLPPGEWRAR